MNLATHAYFTHQLKPSVFELAREPKSEVPFDPAWMSSTLIQERDRLQKALQEVKTLQGLIPICANCKKVRDDQGFWNQIESYMREHTDARFSHRLCPECEALLYPDQDED